MRFKGLDLNLLYPLRVLLEEANVSRAAQRTNMSQPAMSGALARLREYYGDDLLVQVGRVRQGGVISAVAVGHRQAALAVMCRG